jgi:hypothetical protein
MLLLGDFQFQDFEIPEKIAGLLAGKQMLAAKKLIGGQRVIDAMGPDPADIAWSGRFQGGDLVARASQLATMRDAGQAMTLVCDAIVLTVYVADFHPSYERPWQGAYEIKLMVLPDAPEPAPPSLDDSVNGDLGSANQILGGSVTGGTLDAGSTVISGNLA